MNINYENKTIEMSNAEAKDAGKYGSDKFIELNAIREKFPNFEVVVIKKKTKRKETFRGLSYDYMKKYIKDHKGDEANALINELDTMRGYVDGVKLEFVDEAKYGEIREWFLMTCPEIVNYNETIEKLREKNRKAIEKKNELNKKIA